MNFRRNEFPILKDSTYLDIAHKASLPNPVVDAINQYFTGVQQNGGEKGVWHVKVKEVRERIAALLNAQAAEVAFVKNASEALNFLANGINYGPGENIVISDQEHENNIFPWMNLQRQGVEVRQIRSTAFYFGLEAIEKIVDQKTRAISVSHICSASGFRPPIEHIGGFCQKRGILLFLDATQSVGAVEIDVRTLPVDAIATSTHKWLLGPYGIGFLYCRQDLIQKLTPVFAAKLYTAEYPQMFNTALCTDARRWEIGSLNYSGIYGLGASLSMILSIGIKQIEQKIGQLVAWLRREIESLGLKVVTPENGGGISGILSFEVSNPEGLVKALYDERVIVSARAGRIRVSIHFYNDKSDVTRFIEILRKYV